MLGEINQNNVHLLIPGKVSWIIEYLYKDYNINLHEALNRIYNSKMYKQLSIESTKYWHYSPVDLYKELLEEK